MSLTVCRLEHPDSGVDAPSFRHPWLADAGDGTYRNPVLYADYSDPDVVRVGEDYYLTASSFQCTPGLPILHSRDLVNWTLINHALKNLPDPRYAACQPGCGVWAPAIRVHAGKFWIFFPTPDEGIYVTTSRHPAETWTEPHLVQPGKGLIDPCPFWDDDGQAYLVHAYAGSRAGIKHRLRVCPMAPDGSRLLGEGRIVFHEPEKHPTLEGPKFFKRDGWYYILAPAGGVETGWQVALRARNIFGPYEDHIVLAQGRTSVNGPHQGGLVDSPDGAWWFVHFQDAGLYGRITHLQPVHWEAGWPIMGNQGEPVLRHPKPPTRPPPAICVPATSDEFDAPCPGLQWQWNANHQDDWCSLTARPGWLRLPALPGVPELNLTPHLFLQKFPARGFCVETLLDTAGLQAGEESGLAIIGRAYASWFIRRTAAGNELRLRRDHTETLVATQLPGSLRLRVTVAEDGGCAFSYATHGEFVAIPEPFTARQGVWIGARAGLYASRTGNTTGHADFDYFRFTP